MVYIMHTHTPIPRFLSPVCTMHTEITLWLQYGNSRFSHAICHPNSHEALPFQYCNHVSNYSVQCAIGEIGAGPDCILHTAMTQVWWYWNGQILTFYTLSKNVKFHPFQYLITWVVQCAVQGNTHHAVFCAVPVDIYKYFTLTIGIIVGENKLPSNPINAQQ